VATRTDFIRGPNFATNPVDFVSSGIIASQTSIHDTQTALSASVGALYRINDMVNVGFSFERPALHDVRNIPDESGLSHALAVTVWHESAARHVEQLSEIGGDQRSKPLRFRRVG